MKIDKKAIFLLTLLIPLFLSLSCTPTRPPQVVIQPEPLEMQQSASMAQRFQESTPGNPSVVESAMELSTKHAELSEEAAKLRQENKDLNLQNIQLKRQVYTLESQLQQAQKELTQANDLLIEMRVELNNWKANIIGFRDEMRDAETAQLEALLKILTVLGGEVNVKLDNNRDTDSAVASVDRMNQPEQLKDKRR
jgi:predicted RNase H-like nuclease (RuvC/YqgF family)